MFQTETQIRVRYSETDRMSFVYYGHYAQYFEVARVEAMRSMGITYKKMEEGGFLLPVIEYSIKYFKPAFYDDLLTIKTKIPKLPEVRIDFEYETYNETGVLLNKARTTLVFINSRTNRPCSAPGYFLEKMREYYL